jgi:hypothetical protein
MRKEDDAPQSTDRADQFRAEFSRRRQFSIEFALAKPGTEHIKSRR